jgi:putative membrane protein
MLNPSSQNILKPSIAKNDKQAKLLIFIFSFVVFSAVVLLSNFKLHVQLPFDVHIFATINAFINSIIAVLLVAALIAVKNGKYITHKRIMLTALVLSVIFLISYITHHLLAGEAIFGDSNHDGILSADEKAQVGNSRSVYITILLSHIFLAAIILPFILFTAYRALTAEFHLHKKIARYTWPLWFYVSVTGPVVYWMIKPYYR